MTMPVMSGEEAFRRLKAARPNIKVILSSGYNEAEAIRSFTGKGLAGFLQKPYSSTALTEKVNLILNNPTPAA
jgi:CheY-like chemotaxis protein